MAFLGVRGETVFQPDPLSGQIFSILAYYFSLIADMRR